MSIKRRLRIDEEGRVEEGQTDSALPNTQIAADTSNLRRVRREHMGKSDQGLVNFSPNNTDRLTDTLAHSI